LASKVGQGGRKLEGTTKNFSSMAILLVGKAYTSLAWIQQANEFEIKLGRKADSLVPFGAEEEDE